MQNITYILLAGLLITLVSTVGLLLIKSHIRVAQYIEKHLTELTSVSAGIFLVSTFILINETLEILSLGQSLFAFTIGFILYFVIHHFLKPHRHLGEDHTHDAKESAYKVILGDTIHNIADGLLLVASFGTSTLLGFSNTLSIMIHELPQEISEFIVLKKSGYSNNEAVYRNLASALSIFVGIGIAIVFVHTEVFQGYLLGITSSFFLGVIFTDLFPVHKVIKEKNFHKTFLAVLLGVIFMLVLRNLLGSYGEHEHSDHEDIHIEMNTVEHNSF